VGAAAKGAILGVIRGTKEVGVGATDAIGASASAVVKATAEVGGDVAKAARSAVEGAIAGAKELGITPSGGTT